jgi:hypothetical protein
MSEYIHIGKIVAAHDNLPPNTMRSDNFSDMYIFAHWMGFKIWNTKLIIRNRTIGINLIYLMPINYKKPPIPINGTRGFIKARLI